MRKKLLLAIVLLLSISFLVACQGTELASKEEETYPNQKINLILGWPEGGITDTVARVFAPLLEKQLGQAVTVINKEGASGAIGTEDVNDQEADGYNLLLSAETLANFQVLGSSDLSFEDFDPISMLIQDLKLIVVPQDSKYESFEDLVEDIRANPGKVKLSYSTPAASGHLQGLLFEDLGLDISMTPYGGGSPSMIATISGEVDFTFGNYGTIKDYIETGELRALATFTAEQVEELADIPPMTDVLPESEKYLPLYFPNVLLIKKGAPDQVKEILIEATKEALADPAWQDFVDQQSYSRMDHMTVDEIDEYWKKYSSISSWLLYDAGVAEKSPEEFGIDRY